VWGHGLSAGKVTYLVGGGVKGLPDENAMRRAAAAVPITFIRSRKPSNVRASVAAIRSPGSARAHVSATPPVGRRIRRGESDE
jgi:hypothetical protein